MQDPFVFSAVRGVRPLYIPRPLNRKPCPLLNPGWPFRGNMPLNPKPCPHLHEVAEHGNDLDCLAETHVVGEDAVQPMVMQAHQPAQALG